MIFAALFPKADDQIVELFAQLGMEAEVKEVEDKDGDKHPVCRLPFLSSIRLRSL